MREGPRRGSGTELRASRLLPLRKEEAPAAEDDEAPAQPGRSAALVPGVWDGARAGGAAALAALSSSSSRRPSPGQAPANRIR